MRYTECQAEDHRRDAGDWRRRPSTSSPNYDGKEQGPRSPTKFPNLLVNGASGIAVGMATNIPPHNLSEVIDGTLALLKKPETDIEG